MPSGSVIVNVTEMFSVEVFWVPWSVFVPSMVDRDGARDGVLPDLEQPEVVAGHEDRARVAPPIWDVVNWNGAPGSTEAGGVAVMSTLTCEKSVGTAVLIHAFENVTALAGFPGIRIARPLTATTSPAINAARLSLRTFMSVPLNSSVARLNSVVCAAPADLSVRLCGSAAEPSFTAVSMCDYWETYRADTQLPVGNPRSDITNPCQGDDIATRVVQMPKGALTLHPGTGTDRRLEPCGWLVRVIRATR